MKNFFAFEGADGTGKTTTAKAVAEYLVSNGIPVLLTTEPSRGPIGMAIREKVFPLQGTPSELPDLALLHLFLADRLQHGVQLERIRAKRPDAVIITDRYDLSTYVYQYLLPDREELKATIKQFRGTASIPCPHQYFILTASPQELMRRVSARSSERTKWETPEGLQNVAHYYQHLMHHARNSSAFINYEKWVLIYMNTEIHSFEEVVGFTGGEILAQYQRQGPVDPSPRVYSLEEALRW